MLTTLTEMFMRVRPILCSRACDGRVDCFVGIGLTWPHLVCLKTERFMFLSFAHCSTATAAVTLKSAKTDHHFMTAIPFPFQLQEWGSCDVQVKQDVARVFATGWFKECAPDAEDTRDGVKLIIKVSGGHGCVTFHTCRRKIGLGRLETWCPE